MSARPNDASKFHALHKELLLLPNVWDAASAKMVELAGAKAIATSSAAVAWAHAHVDGHDLPISRLVICVEEIAKATKLPITADAEGGYSDNPAEVGENVAALIQAGAVGINLEDGKWPHELHLKKIEAARKAAVREGVDLFINARTDVYLKQLVPAEQAVGETLRRAKAMREAGASGLFAPGVFAAAEIGAIVKQCGMPLNVMARPGVPKSAELQSLGVKRLSAATATFNAAMEATRAAAAAFLADADSDALWAGRGEPPNWNELFR